MAESPSNKKRKGLILKETRESKGIDLMSVHEVTKIPMDVLRAIEEGYQVRTLSPFYVKGFMKMYAQYLGLDARPLVDEYVAQHAPRAKPNLGEEVRQKLSQADQVSVDADGTATLTPASVGSRIFGDVNEAMIHVLLGSKGERELPWKIILPSAGGLLLLAIIVMSATQCADEKETEPAPVGGAASVEREVITDGAPDVFLGKPGEIEVDM